MTDKQVSLTEGVSTIIDYSVENNQTYHQNPHSQITKISDNLCDSHENVLLNQEIFAQEQALSKLYGMFSDGSITVDGFLDEIRRDNIDDE